MRPGAIERWRILNGSVDGAGTKRFMVLDGQFVQRKNLIWRVMTDGDGDERTRRLEPTTQVEIEAAKLDLQQLSFDGITLVSEESGEARHVIRDLAKQNAGGLPDERQSRRRIFQSADRCRRPGVYDLCERSAHPYGSLPKPAAETDRGSQIRGAPGIV